MISEAYLKMFSNVQRKFKHDFLLMMGILALFIESDHLVQLSDRSRLPNEVFCFPL